MDQHDPPGSLYLLELIDYSIKKIIEIVDESNAISLLF